MVIYCEETHPYHQLAISTEFQVRNPPDFVSEDQFCGINLQETGSFVYFGDWNRLNVSQKEGLAVIVKTKEGLYSYGVRDYESYCEMSGLQPYEAVLNTANRLVSTKIDAFSRELQRKLSEIHFNFLVPGAFSSDFPQTLITSLSQIKQQSLRTLLHTTKLHLKSTVSRLHTPALPPPPALHSYISRLTHLQTTLKSFQTGPIPYEIAGINQEIEENILLITDLLEKITAQKHFPCNLTWGKMTKSDVLLLCIRWKKWKNGDFMQVRVEISDGECSPKSVFLTNYVEVVPFTCSKNGIVQLKSANRDETLAKNGLSTELIPEIEPVDLNFDPVRFQNEQKVLEILENEGKLTYGGITQLKTLLDAQVTVEECLERLR